MKLSVDHETYLDAIAYTTNSLNYTYEYETQVGNGSKEKRVFTGQLAQRVIGRFLRINNRDVEFDDTPFHVDDNYDIKINGFVVDIKASLTDWPLQITYEKNREGTDYFCSCKIHVTGRLCLLTGRKHAYSRTHFLLLFAV